MTQGTEMLDKDSSAEVWDAKRTWFCGRWLSYVLTSENWIAVCDERNTCFYIRESKREDSGKCDICISAGQHSQIMSLVVFVHVFVLLLLWFAQLLDQLIGEEGTEILQSSTSGTMLV